MNDDSRACADTQRSPCDKGPGEGRVKYSFRLWREEISNIPPMTIDSDDTSQGTCITCRHVISSKCQLEGESYALKLFDVDTKRTGP